MSTEPIFSAGSEGLVPKADEARQAVDALRGYVYQVTAAALAWLDLGDHSAIFLEVAEDYAIVAKNAINAVQVKDTVMSGSVTLNTSNIREAIANYVALINDNPGKNIRLEYFTTSMVGLEKNAADLNLHEPGLSYWRKAALSADVAPIRRILQTDKYSLTVKEFVEHRTDDAIRTDLLQNIHWNCGNPDLTTLRIEFNSRLTTICWDQFKVPYPDVPKIADHLLYRVLETSIGKTPSGRKLTRSDLIRTIHEYTFISIPRPFFHTLSEASTAINSQVQGNRQSDIAITMGSPIWLAKSELLVKASRQLSRCVTEARIEAKLRTSGVCFITGASGVGKTQLARAVADKLGWQFVMADFRNINSEEAAKRLSTILSYLGGLHAKAIVLEDLNCFNDPTLALALTQVFSATARRDIAIIVTSYNSPATKSLTAVGLDTACEEICPYFSEDEASQLVALYDGDPNAWGKLAYATGAAGHPQLVHAFVAGMAARGWLRSEMSDVVMEGFSTNDVNLERDAARRTIATALPEGARNLLYRASVIIGSFDRDCVLRLAGIQPSLPSPGENLDALIGPWLETMGRDRYRISPLAAQIGQKMIARTAQVQLHHEIAEHLMSRQVVDVSDIDKIVMHAMIGKNTQILGSIAANLLASESSVIEYLACNFSVVRLLATERPIYPEDLSISTMMRIAQFKILAVAKDYKSISKCVDALNVEIEAQPAGTSRDVVQVLGFCTVLGTLGIANYLNNWLALLQRFESFIGTSTVAREMHSDSGNLLFSEEGMIPALFAIGSADLQEVASLERVFDQLNGISAADRDAYLSLIRSSAPDYSAFVNGPWLAEHRKALDYSDAADRYRRMATTSASWKVRRLTLQCWIARAVMLDEYGNDQDRALRALDEAESEHGPDILVSRARAKIFWRAKDHVRALSILRAIADVVGQDNFIERAFALREAAISAASTGDWNQAETWFQSAQTAALRSTVDDMRIMAIGLGADTAVAALENGRSQDALMGIGAALRELEAFPPQSSLRAAYCHHVVRHVILWLNSRIEDVACDIDGEPITVKPGCCSNPEPDASFMSRPLGAVNIAWYMLAQLDVTSRSDIGYVNALRSKMGGESILPMELMLRSALLMRSIQDLDCERFIDRMWDFVECGVATLPSLRSSAMQLNAFNPETVVIPDLLSPPSGKESALFINDSILAFAICCATKLSSDLLSVMRQVATTRFGPDIASSTALSFIGESTVNSSFEAQLIGDLSFFKAGSFPTPKQYCVSGIRSLQQAQQSGMKRELVRMIAAWQRKAWTRIIASETFRLPYPRLSVPSIKDALLPAKDDERFLCGLLLITADATEVTLPNEIREDFRSRSFI
ncbi:AAA family ATPase [Dokdonella sp. MW10]|uniref:AAA family ATPase n=1 Tax=Dokdonella sp. MW10 TaxID=2992926 RepID=UPI003F7F86A4